MAAGILIPLAISAATSAASYGVEYLAAKNRKVQPVDRGKADDIRFSLPGYGEALLWARGMCRTAPVWFWDTPIIHSTVTTPGQSGGKGPPKPPTPDTIDHIYTKSMAGAFHDGLITGGVTRIWFDTDLVYNANFSSNFLELASTRYEAEIGTLGGGASITTQAECSGGKKVTGLGSGGHVTIPVTVDSTGSYVVAVHYTSTVSRTFKVSVNGGALTDLVCAASGAASIVAIETITVSLTSGANTIKFENSGAACPDLDYIDVVPALAFTDGLDTRSFSGLIDPAKVPPTNQNEGWAGQNEIPVFSETAGGFTNGGFFTATLAKWGQPQIRIYPGSETQEPDPAIVADKGAGNAPAYRGVAYVVIEGLQLPAGHMPNVTIEFNQGTRELPVIVSDIYSEVAIDSADMDLTALGGMVLGDMTGYSAGTYSPISWGTTQNVSVPGGGAISKNAGADNTWNAYASGSSISAGTDCAIRFTASAGVFMIGFATTQTPGSSLPNPYAQVPFAVLLNVNSNPSQESKNAIQMSLGGSNNSFDVGVWAPGDVFQVEIRGNHFAAYQNGILLTGFSSPVPSFPLYPIFVGYKTGGGVSVATVATGADIGSTPTVPNTGALLLTSRRAAGELIQELQTRFQFDLPEVDGKIKAVLRNGTSELTIPYSELRAHYDGEETPAFDALITDIDPLLLPFDVTINYLDPQRDFHNNSQYDRRVVGPQSDSQSVSLSMAEAADNIKKLATVLLYKPDREGRQFRFTTGPKYMRVHQGTVVTLTLPNATHIVRVVEPKYGLPAGVCEFESVRQEASVYSPTGTGTSAGTEPPIVPIPANTKGIFIDAPLAQPENAEGPNHPIVYVAMSGRGAGQWNGAFLYREHPLGSQNYQLITSTDKAAGIGLASTALVSVADTTVIDSTSSLQVQFYSDRTFGSATESELTANPMLNLLAVLNPSGEVEYVQFKDALAGVAIAPFVTKYTFTNFFRGRFDTDHSVSIHTTSDDVVVMDSAIKSVPMDADRANISINYKFVSSGQSVDDAAVVPFTWRGRSLTPRSPTGIDIYRDTKTGSLANQIQVSIPTREHEVGEIVKYWADVFSATAGPTFTVDALTNVFTSTSHGLTAGDTIALSTSGVLPSPLNKFKHYFLRDITTNTFKLSESNGGDAVDLIDTGSGTHKFTRRVRHMPVENIGAFNPAVITIYTPDDTPPPDGEWQHSTASGSGGWDSTITTEWTERNNVVGDGPGATGGGITGAALALFTESGAELEFTLGTVDYEPGISTDVELVADGFSLDASETIYRRVRFELFTDTDLPPSKAGSRRWKLKIYERISGVLTLVYTDPDFELPGMKYRLQISGSELRYYRDYGGPNSTLLYRSTLTLPLPVRPRFAVATDHLLENIKIGGLSECVTTYPDTDMISDFGTQPATVRFRVYEERTFAGVSFFGPATDFIT